MKFDDIKVCVFDAYGTLFDVHAAVGHHRARLGDKADAVSAMWRTKQLEYTWLRSLMDRYVPFWQVTGDALDYAFDAHGVSDPSLREDLLNAYMQLDCYPEVPEVLASLKDAGMRTAILSNGSPEMLDAAVKSSKLDTLLDAVLSVDELGIFKPHPSVYQLAVDRLGVAPRQVSFQSSNAWDAAAAATFGFRVAWVNRFGQSEERLPDRPDVQLRTLSELPAVVLS
ncbi:MAG: haloacid dehalogenase type II [Gammaproteobacteria bacterium]|nr:haloacid dehalogenase type II [Gammaproteobacteria bacterium]NIM74575.1 haloacid dehalogenase type II [Gammaproteobacteria bacterium]NIO26408.1 haloacid dehalogenase type II [Gammaproteobacteria bacterium]NIO66960.1 haloacid dehalogenase type II [Gammaproteobacteria bacterium]NIP44970.1 haloacid dehalogenase type II [Gammaproteobacteria bacterium]